MGSSTEKVNEAVNVVALDDESQRMPELVKENIFKDDPNYKPSKMLKFMGNFWDSFTKPPNERRYLMKLDAFVLSYALLSYGLKSMDVNNISNAYVSGMKEDLGLYGNERNLFNTFFNLGYLVGSTPSQVIINRVRPSIWIPTCEVVWSIVVMCIAAAKNAKTIYGLRFVLGLFESVSYPGFAYILGCWYGPDELAKRMGVYDLAGYAANMFAGYIQAGIYAGLNGAHGIAGWRWMFIIDGCIGFPVAILGYISIPDFPNNTRAIWLTQEDRATGLLRMKAFGKKQPRKLTFKRFFDIFFRSWRPWPFMISYVTLWISGTSSYFNLWLKAVGYTTVQVNIIPTGGYAVGIFTGFWMANLSDRFQKRWPFLMTATATRFLGSLLLSIWYVPKGVIFFANLCSYMSEPVWSLLITWASEEFQDDAELRGLLCAVGNSVGASFSMWLPLIIFPSYDAPHYKYGYIVTACLDVVDFFALLAFYYLAKRERAKRNVVINAYGYAVDRDEYMAYLEEVKDRENQGVVEVAKDNVQVDVVSVDSEEKKAAK
ncbi:major facilitator superfamily domain-containing protein [Dipodascopsis tothii]|uniref:major facilitator superfamily domain-containing protein n=1 Tax=Dipodascopsis tothii TaxID=44089 RepID=UPI0034CDF9DF